MCEQIVLDCSVDSGAATASLRAEAMLHLTMLRRTLPRNLGSGCDGLADALGYGARCSQTLNGGATRAVGVQTCAAQLPKQRGDLWSHVNNHCTHACEFSGKGHVAHRAMLDAYFLMDAMPLQTSCSTPCHSRCMTCYLLMLSRVAPSSCWTVCCSLLERNISNRIGSGCMRSSKSSQLLGIRRV